MENRILIAENKEFAEAKIKELENKAVTINALVAFYNDLPVINSLETKETIFAFLKDPLNYFENALLNETGVNISAKVKPKPEIIAQMLSIPYAPVIEKIVKSRISNLDLFDYLPENGIFLTDTAIEQLYEAVKEYTRDEIEMEAYLRAQEVCKVIDAWIDDFGLTISAPHYRIAKELGLEAVGIVGGYKLEPSIYKIRQALSFPGRKEAFKKR